jgi:hypothetical protein
LEGRKTGDIGSPVFFCAHGLGFSCTALLLRFDPVASPYAILDGPTAAILEARKQSVLIHPTVPLDPGGGVAGWKDPQRVSSTAAAGYD